MTGIWTMYAWNKWFFSTIKRNSILGDAVTVFFHNVRSLPIHADDIVSDNRIINNDVIRFMET